MSFTTNKLNTDRRFIDVCRQCSAGCSLVCQLGRDCLSKLDIKTMHKYIENFWGKIDDLPKGPQERLESIKKLFLDATYDVS